MSEIYQYLPDLINICAKDYTFNGQYLYDSPIAYKSLYTNFIDKFDLNQQAILIDNESFRIQYGSNTVLYYHYIFLYIYLVVNKDSDLFHAVIKQAINQNKLYWVNNILAIMIQDEHLQNFILNKQCSTKLKKLLTKDEKKKYVQTLIKTFFPLEQWPYIKYKPIFIEQLYQLSKIKLYKNLTNDNCILILNSFLDELNEIPSDNIQILAKSIINISNNWKLKVDDKTKQRLISRLDIILRKHINNDQQINFYEALKLIIKFTPDEKEKYDHKLAKKLLLHISKK